MADNVAWHTTIRRATPGTRPCSGETRSEAEAACRRRCLGWGWTVFVHPLGPCEPSDRAPVAWIRQRSDRTRSSSRSGAGGRWSESQVAREVRASVAQRRRSTARALLQDAGTLAAASSDGTWLWWRCQMPRRSGRRNSSRCGAAGERRAPHQRLPCPRAREPQKGDVDGVAAGRRRRGLVGR
jgi:hypothetical protein